MAYLESSTLHYLLRALAEFLGIRTEGMEIRGVAQRIMVKLENEFNINYDYKELILKEVEKTLLNVQKEWERPMKIEMRDAE